MRELVNFGRALLADETFRGSGGVFATKLFGALLGFAMFALASHQMPPAEFGSLAMIFNAMAFIAVVALCGQETLIVRSWNEYCGSGRPALARGALAFGARIVLAAALIAAACTALVWLVFVPDVAVTLVLAACAYLLAQAISHFSAQFTRVAAGPIMGEAPRELFWRVIVVAVLVVHHLTGTAIGITGFFAVTAAAMVLTISVQIAWVARLLPASVRRARPQRDIADWRARSWKMWLAALMDTTAQYVEVILIGLVLGPIVAGFYFVATRVANVFALISASISIYASSRISALFYANSKDDLQAMLAALAIVSAGLVGAGLVLVLIVGKLLLSAFGAVYASAYPALIVLAAGGSIAALAGPAAHLLLLTGHEGAYPRIMGCGIVLRFVLIAILGPMLGLVGAALASAISAAAVGLALTIASCRLVGVDPSLRSTIVRAPSPMAPVRGETL